MARTDIPGYAGNGLWVNLTSGEIRNEPLNPDWVKAFIGGHGISNLLAHEFIPPDADALSPENAIIIGTGPFAGTIVPGSAKLHITTKFPINHAFTTASGGGHFALMLKSSGYDYVVITGRAERPVYLKIAERDVELCDARWLWGKDTFETVDELRASHEPCSVIPIGQAGENLVKISITAIDKGGTLGSAGLPAVMGSKNLKAIVAQKGGAPVMVAHRLRLQRLVDRLLERMMAYRLRPTLVEEGTLTMAAGFTTALGRPNKNWTEVRLGEREEAGSIAELHKAARKPLACASCPLADKELNKLAQGEFAGMTTYLTHFMLLPEWGTKRALDEHNRSVKYLDMANRYGICTFSFSGVLGLLVYLYEQGIITREDTEGVELKDDFETTAELLRMTAHREGFGDVLAEGIVGAAQTMGAESHAVHIKGYNIISDPRVFGLGTMQFEQLVNPARCVMVPGGVGAPSYNPGWPVERWLREARKMGISEQTLGRIIGETSFNPARLTRYAEDWYSLFNCLSLCHRLYINRFYDIETIAELYSAITGIETSPAELLTAAERAWNLWKVLNVRAGFGRKDDRAPEIWFEPLQGGDEEHRLMDYYKTTIVTREDVDRLIDDYYEERGWDKKSGVPTAEKLKELGLESMALGI